MPPSGPWHGVSPLVWGLPSTLEYAAEMKRPVDVGRARTAEQGILLAQTLADIVKRTVTDPETRRRIYARVREVMERQ